MVVIGGCCFVVMLFVSKFIIFGVVLVCFDMKVSVISMNDFGIFILYVELWRYVVLVIEFNWVEFEIFVLYFVGEVY